MEYKIAYKNYKKSSDIHGSVLYPAVMIAPVQKLILKDILDNTDIKTVLDPFYGSGTSLYEATEIDNSIEVFGCDINPLANLITTVKLQGVDDTIAVDIEEITEFLKKEMDVVSHDFDNINKWFRNDVIQELSRIRVGIQQICNKKSRQFFWCMMSDIIRKSSNTRSSTYKLHVKQQEKITLMENKVVESFLSSINLNASKYHPTRCAFSLAKEDVLEYLPHLDDGSIDLSITSPPYGDNATTVPYGQFSSLSLRWIDKKDLNMDGWEVDNYSIIDSSSLGGTNSSAELDDYETSLISDFFIKISEDKQKKVIKFFSDYFKFLSELCRVTSKFIVITLGNRHVDGIEINLTGVTKKYIKNHGFELINNMERAIPNKRMAKFVAIKKGNTVETMNKEYVLVFKKTI